MKKKLIIIYIASALIIAGCVSGGSNIVEGSKYKDNYEAFLNGDIRFDCKVSCSGTWGANKNEILQLHKNGLAKDVAYKVMNIGFLDMNTYYLLGSSAEALGYPKAALIYYALGQNIYCTGSACDELFLPKMLEERITALSAPSNTSALKENDKIIEQMSTNPIKVQCDKAFPWKKGDAAKRVDCLNKQWIDYIPSASSYVNDFKDYRYDLAKQVDKGAINTTKYAILEQQGLDRLITKVIPTEKLKQIELNTRGTNSLKAQQPTQSNTVVNQLSLTPTQKLKQFELSPNSPKKPSAQTLHSNTVINEPPVILPSQNVAYQELEKQSDSTDYGNSFGDVLVSILGSTLKLAVAVAPIILNGIVQSNINSWNAYYAYQYNRPKTTTCITNYNLMTCQ